MECLIFHRSREKRQAGSRISTFFQYLIKIHLNWNFRHWIPRMVLGMSREAHTETLGL